MKKSNSDIVKQAWKLSLSTLSLKAWARQSKTPEALAWLKGKTDAGSALERKEKRRMAVAQRAALATIRAAKEAAAKAKKKDDKAKKEGK